MTKNSLETFGQNSQMFVLVSFETQNLADLQC